MVELQHSAKRLVSNPFIKQKKQSVTDRKRRQSYIDESRLHEILETIPSAVLVFQKSSGKVIYANKRAYDLYGVNPCGITLAQYAENLIICSLNGNRFPTEKLFTYHALYSGKTTKNALVTIERPDGKRFIVDVTAKPLYDSDGKIIGALTILLDVTERTKAEKALKESENRLKMAQKIAYVGSWEYRIKEDKALWSEELFHIFGLKPQRYGPSTTEYIAKIHPDDREAINTHMERILFRSNLQSKASFDYRIIRKDGVIRTIHSERMVSGVDCNGKATCIAGVEQDITERKQTEQKLEDYAKNLECLVEERTKQLKDAERLAAIGQTAGMIGHDIRNPLQTIAGELFLMKQDIDSSPDSQCKRDVQESLASIQDQIEYMNKIVADLQDFTRPLNPEFVEVDLTKLLPQIVLTVNVPDNIETRAELDINLQKIKIDATFLKRIIVNLLTNAVQAMPNGGKLTLKAHCQNGGIAIAVQDTGVGIPDEVKPRIFQPLMTTKSKGQGFGLAVVKRLVEAQGGNISFESKVGVGTEFLVVFPFPDKKPA
jgi:PAS domain S-box-containing protein